jgi:hypothetical protein
LPLLLNSTQVPAASTRVAAAAGAADAAAPSAAGAIGFVQDKREISQEAKKAAFNNAVNYFTELSNVNAEKVNNALLAAIAVVDNSTASARSAISTLGKGLTAKAVDLKSGGGSLLDKVGSKDGAGGCTPVVCRRWVLQGLA